MKFRCERDVLLDGLTTAGRAVSTRGGALPVLSGVRLQLSGDTLVLTGSDLDITITMTIQVAGDGDGVAVIPSRLFVDIVRAVSPGAVVVEVAEDEARVIAGRSEFSLRIFPADEYPHLVHAQGEGVAIDAIGLAGALKQVIPAASSDDSRPILTGVLLASENGGLRLVATDSYRLAVRDLPGTQVLGADQEVLVPSKALSEVAKLLGAGGTVTLRLGERDASFEVGGVQLTTRLIEGAFPNYRGLIPSSQPNELRVGRDSLLDAVRRVRLLAQEATPVRLGMNDGTLELVAVTQDVGQAHEELDASYNGTDLTVAFNPEYLLDGIEAAQGEELVLQTVDALKPAVIRTPGRDDFLYLLMPVRVS